jgi:hypothetical protein
MGVTEVTFVRRPAVDLALLQRGLHLIRKYAGRQARDELDRFVGIGCVQNVIIIIYQGIVPQESQLRRVLVAVGSIPDGGPTLCFMFLNNPPTGLSA